MTYIGVGAIVLLLAWTLYAVLKARSARKKALAYQREQWDEEFRKVHRGRWPPPPPMPSAPGDWHVSTKVTRTRKHTVTSASVHREPSDPDVLSPSDPVPWPSWSPSVGTPAPIESDRPTEIWSGGGGHSGGAGASGSWDSGSSDCGGTSSSDSGSSDSGGSDGGSCGGSSD